MEPWLELLHVEAWLGARRVVRDLTLTLARGQHAVVLGPNGAGKSTLLRLISREIHPVVRPGSHLRLFGQERIVLHELQRRLGLVSPALEQRFHPALPVQEVVGSGWFGSVGLGRHHRLSPSQADRVAEVLADHGLEELAGRPCGQLSDGQRRRVLLARALVRRPEVLVLDEPLNGLDLRARHQLLLQLRRSAAAGTTLLLVTHQIEAVVPEISCCVLLRQGEVVAVGPPGEVLRDGPLSALFETPLQVVEAGGYRQVLPA
jgi:iron complex transport system ATP-binding protein